MKRKREKRENKRRRGEVEIESKIISLIWKYVLPLRHV
jgi:hypothetical protein